MDGLDGKGEAGGNTENQAVKRLRHGSVYVPLEVERTWVKEWRTAVSYEGSDELLRFIMAEIRRLRTKTAVSEAYGFSMTSLAAVRPDGTLKGPLIALASERLADERADELMAARADPWGGPEDGGISRRHSSLRVPLEVERTWIGGWMSTYQYWVNDSFWEWFAGELRKAGTVTNLADRHGLSRKVAFAALSALHRGRPPFHITASLAAQDDHLERVKPEILRMYAEGYYATGIVKRLKVRLADVNRIAQEAGIWNAYRQCRKPPAEDGGFTAKGYAEISREMRGTIGALWKAGRGMGDICSEFTDYDPGALALALNETGADEDEIRTRPDRRPAARRALRRIMHG